jgi:hypothetical protein
MMRLGRVKSYQTFGTLVVREALLTEIFMDIASLYENIMLSDDDREAFHIMKEAWYVNQEEEGEHWYFTPFFLNFSQLSPYKAREIRQNSHLFESLTMGLVRAVMEGWQHHRNEYPWYAWTDPSTNILKKVGEGELSDTLREIEEQNAKNQWSLDETYTASLTNAVYELYGHIGIGLLYIEHLVKAQGKSQNLLPMTELCVLYRDLISFLHVSYVIRMTGTDQAVLIVGHAHVKGIERLFHNADYEVRTYESVPITELPEWSDFFGAYLTLEALDAWIGHDIDIGGISQQPRLQLYMFMEYIDKLDSLLITSIKLKEKKELKALANLMAIFFFLFTTVSPYETPLREYRTQPLEMADQHQWIESMRVFYTRLGYPVALIEILVQCRDLVFVHQFRRGPGEWLSEEFLLRITALGRSVDTEHLETDWPSGMEQTVMPDFRGEEGCVTLNK